MRESKKTLEALVDRINEVLGMPEKPYSDKRVDGYLIANIGNYHINSAYGGYSIYRMSNEHGGVNDGAMRGRYSLGEMVRLCRAFLDGIEAASNVIKAGKQLHIY